MRGERIQFAEMKNTPNEVVVDLRDVRGNVIAKISYEADPVEHDLSVAGRLLPARRIRKLSLLYAKDGTERAFDLIERFSSHKPEVYVADALPGEGVHSQAKGFVAVKKITNQGDLAVLLHELRHCQQPFDSRLRGLGRFQGLPQTFHPGRPWRREAVEMLPHILGEIFGQLKELSGGVPTDAVVERVASLASRIPKDGMPDAIRRAQEDVLNADVMPGINVRDVLALPMWLMERDADFGSLQSVRTIRRETGVDLSKDFPDPKVEFLRSLPPEEQRARLDVTSEPNPILRKMMRRLERSLRGEAVGETVLDQVRRHMKPIGMTEEKLGTLRKSKALRLKREAP